MTNKLFDVIHDELGYSTDCSWEIVDAVKEWISQYICDESSVFGEYTTGYDDAFRTLMENLEMKETNRREEIQKQIEELQTALKLLEIEENRRTPCEKAYRDAYGEFPITDSMSGGDGDYIAWIAFQKGYNAAYKEKLEEAKKLYEKDWKFDVKTDLKPHWEPKPQEPEEVEEGLRKSFREAVKKGVVSSSQNPKTLWRRFYDEKWSYRACDEFCEIVEQWLPEPIKETCGMKDWDSAWTIGYNNYRDTLMEKLK